MTSGTGRGVQHSFAYFREGFFCNALASFFIVEAFFALATGFAFALSLPVTLQAWNFQHLAHHHHHHHHHEAGCTRVIRLFLRLATAFFSFSLNCPGTATVEYCKPNGGPLMLTTVLIPMRMEWTN